MNTVTISKKEYAHLKSHALAYKKMAESLFSAMPKDPISEVVGDFPAAGFGVLKKSFGKTNSVAFVNKTRKLY